MERSTILGVCFIISCFLAVTILGADSCKNNDNGRTYYPGDCNKYIQCTNGQPSVESCGWFYRFDENSNQCKFHWFLFGMINCTLADGGSTPNPTPSPTESPTNGPTSTSKPSGSSTTEMNIFLFTICAVLMSFKLI